MLANSGICSEFCLSHDGNTVKNQDFTSAPAILVSRLHTRSTPERKKLLVCPAGPKHAPVQANVPGGGRGVVVRSGVLQLSAAVIFTGSSFSEGLAGE